MAHPVENEAGTTRCAANEARRGIIRKIYVCFNRNTGVAWPPCSAAMSYGFYLFPIASCICRLEGDPVTLTYDRQNIILTGANKYTLSKDTYNTSDPCSFNIEVKVTFLVRQQRVQYATTMPRFLDIEVLGYNIHLGQNHVAIVSISVIPFYSLQCGIHFMKHEIIYALSIIYKPWWRREMKAFSALLAFFEKNPTVPVGSPHKGQWRRFDVFFYLRLNKRLRKWPRRWWFGTPLCSLWRNCSDFSKYKNIFVFSIISEHWDAQVIAIPDCIPGRRPALQVPWEGNHRPPEDSPHKGPEIR